MASDERSTASTLTLARYLGRVGLPATTPLSATEPLPDGARCYLVERG